MKTKNDTKYDNRINNTRLSDSNDNIARSQKSKNLSNNVRTSSKIASAQFSPTFDSIWISFESLLEPQGMIDCELIFQTKNLIKLGESECKIIFYTSKISYLSYHLNLSCENFQNLHISLILVNKLV